MRDDLDSQTRTGVPAKTPAPPEATLSRTVQYYTLLIAVVGCVNLWIYWVQENRLSLVLAVVALAGAAVWYFGARRILESLDRRKG